MKNRYPFSMFLLIVLFAVDALSAEKRPESTDKLVKASKITKAQSKTVPENQLAWEEALGQVKLLAAKFQEYRDTAIAARSLAALASTVCKYDKTQAPVLFSRDGTGAKRAKRLRDIRQQRTALAGSGCCDFLSCTM